MSVIDPWPGPRPYKELESDIFFGRKDEEEAIVREIHTNQITVLVAHSGIGKTSLLQAGVVAGLRRLREHSEKNADSPPILMIRDWAEALNSPDYGVLTAGVIKSVKDLENICVDDFKLLNGVKPEKDINFPDLRDYLSKLCGSAGGIIVIFDQFEEVLRAGKKIADDIIDQLEEVYRWEERAKILISMRQEHIGSVSWQLLEDKLFPMHDYTYRLDPMNASSLRQAINGAAKHRKIHLEDGLMEEVFNAVGSNLSSGDLMSSTSLLQLQALLIGVYKIAKLRENSEGVLSIFLSDLKHYSDELEEKFKYSSIYNVDRSSIATLSLYDYISNAIEEKTEENSDLNNYEELLVKRAASRFIHRLGSGTHKSKIEYIDLVIEALRKDLIVLGASVEKFRKKFGLSCNTLRELEERTIAANSENLLKEEISGIVKEANKKPIEVINMLVSACEVALERLGGDRNIIRQIRGSKGDNNILSYELIHDAFIEQLILWAENYQETFEYVLASPVALSGSKISVEDKICEDIVCVKWGGCIFDAVKFEEMSFIKSNLVGCIFKKCEFKNVKFIDCVLNSDAFIGCNFIGKVEITGIHEVNSLLIRESTIDNLIFDSVEINRFKVDKRTKGGYVNFYNSEVRFSQFDLGEEIDGDNSPIYVFDSNCIIERSWAPESKRDKFKLATHDEEDELFEKLKYKDNDDKTK